MLMKSKFELQLVESDEDSEELRLNFVCLLNEINNLMSYEWLQLIQSALIVVNDNLSFMFVIKTKEHALVPCSSWSFKACFRHQIIAKVQYFPN